MIKYENEENIFPEWEKESEPESDITKNGRCIFPKDIALGRLNSLEEKISPIEKEYEADKKYTEKLQIPISGLEKKAYNLAYKIFGKNMYRNKLEKQCYLLEKEANTILELQREQEERYDTILDETFYLREEVEKDENMSSLDLKIYKLNHLQELAKDVKKITEKTKEQRNNLLTKAEEMNQYLRKKIPEVIPCGYIENKR